MNDDDARVFAFIRFARDPDVLWQDAGMRSQLDLRVQLDLPYRLGRLAEGRILAASGAACGYFAVTAARRWLERTDAIAANLAAVVPPEVLERVPPVPTSDELLRLASQVRESADAQRKFLQTLLARNSIDGDSDARNVMEELLFADDEQWAQRMAVLGSDDAAGPADYLLMDGAIAVPNAAAELLDACLWSRRRGEVLWPSLDLVLPSAGRYGSAWDDRFSLLAVAEEALARLDATQEDESPRRGKQNADELLLRFLALGPDLWTSAPMFADELREQALGQLYGALAARAAERLPFAPNSDAWPTLLWRTAPMDSRSLWRLADLMQAANAVLVRQLG